MLITFDRQRHAPSSPDRRGARRGRDRGRGAPPSRRRPGRSPRTLVVFAIDTSGSLRAGRPGARAASWRRASWPSFPAAPRPRSSRSTTRRGSWSAGRRDPEEIARRAGRRCGGRDATPRSTTRSTTPTRYLRDAGAGRRALVLITDGRDEDSAVELADGLAVAQQAGIPVFTVGVGRVEERVLRRVAKLTGGQYIAAARRRAPGMIAAPHRGVRGQPPPRAAAAPRPRGDAPTPRGRDPRPASSAATRTGSRRGAAAPGNGARPLVWIAVAHRAARSPAPRPAPPPPPAAAGGRPRRAGRCARADPARAHELHRGVPREDGDAARAARC